jgi:hypothetical protein
MEFLNSILTPSVRTLVLLLLLQITREFDWDHMDQFSSIQACSRLQVLEFETSIYDHDEVKKFVREKMPLCHGRDMLCYSTSRLVGS